MRQTVVYCCVHQLWRSLSVFSEDRLPLSQDKGEGDLELQLLAAMLALSARAYLKQEQSSTKKKRLKQSIVEPSRGLDCSSCGPLSPRSASPVKSEPSSEMTVGYVSISPSPSELALPNVVYTSRENLLDNEVDYSPILSSVSFSSLVVLREALLPFYVVSGLRVDPQLSTLCHNSAEYFLDLIVTVREVTAFVCKSIDVKTSSSSSPDFSHLIINSSPSLIGEQLAISGCVRYCTSPEIGRVRRSQRITLLKPSIDHESNEKVSPSRENNENKTNISCKCCVSLDNLASTVTTPLLKLSRHMTETARFRSKVRKQASMRTDDLLATPRPPLDDEEEVRERVPEIRVLESVDGDSEGVPQTTTEVFAQSIVNKLVGLELDTLPVTKESGNATPSSTCESSVNIKLVEYTRSPRVSKSWITTAPSAVIDEPDIPKLDPLSDGSEGMGRGMGRGMKLRRHSTASNNSSTSANDVAVTIEEIGTPLYHAHNNTSPEEVLSTQDTYGEDTTDMMSSDVDGDTRRSKRQRVKVKSRKKDSTTFREFTDSDHTHQSPLKVFSLTEGELLYSVFGLLRINRIGCDVQIETTKLSVELNAISGAVDVRKSLPSSQPQQRSPSIAELDHLLHFDLLPTYLSVAATLRRSLVRINDRHLPDNDILLFSALPVYGSVGVFNHTHQRLPTYRCLLKFAGLELDIKQSPVRVHRRYQQLLPAFTKIYNDVFASSSEEGNSLPPSVVTSSETTPDLIKISNLKLPSHFPRGVIHFKIDKMILIMAPLPSLTVTYQVRPWRGGRTCAHSTVSI